MRRISKRVREEAIEALLIAADWHTYDRDLPGCIGRHAAVDITGFVCQLVGEAVEAVDPFTRGMDADDACLLLYLEAAFLLREGWNPGDPVEVLS